MTLHQDLKGQEVTNSVQAFIRPQLELPNVLAWRKLGVMKKCGKKQGVALIPVFIYTVSTVKIVES